MRDDTPGTLIRSRHREPRTAVAIIYPSGSIYLTSRQGIANVPGNVIHGTLKDISSTSQTLAPDEGRATIGTMSFTAVDLNGALTAELREQLRVFSRGIRLREVRVFTGDTDDFNDFVRVETYVVDDVVDLTERSYRISCSDRNRELRKDIYEQVGTRLDATLTIDDSTVTVQSTEGFELLEHTAAFTDAPSQTVGYFRVRKTGEIIRYTGKTDTTFTGCTRERFGTVAQRVDVDAETAAEKRPEIEEFIYLEMPGPQLLYAIQTGSILGTTIELPPAWHLGIDPAHIDTDQYNRIGADLFDPDDHTKGLILRFTHLESVDGKRFCEEQLHIPMGTFAPIDTLGRLGLRRLVSLLSTAAPVALLNSSNIISHDTVRYVQRKVINEQLYDWNYDGEEYTRTDIFFNEQSIIEHGRTKPKELDFAGLYVSRHSREVLQRIADTFTDRYAAPPIEFSLQLSREMNHLEIGDPVRIQLDRVRDHSDSGTLDRVFEIQSRRINWRTGELSANVFGSTSRGVPNRGSGVEPVLADAWYPSEGTALSSVLTMSGNNVVANGTLTGAADARNAVYYHDGDLIVDGGVVLSIDDNVQLRVRGELTVNGRIDGAGRGTAGLTDPNTLGEQRDVYPIANTGAYFGVTQPSEGVLFFASRWQTFQAPRQHGQHSAAARLALEVDDNGGLGGLPADLRGTRGGFGCPAMDGSQIVRGKGGAGGNGGAGLFLVCRGLEFGASGKIDLSGANGSPPGGTVSLGGVDIYPGAGAGGAPGVLYVIVDGDNVPHPDLSASFRADQGATPQTGTPLSEEVVFSAPADGTTGKGAGLGAADHWEAAHLIQYVPSDIEPGESDDELVPPPLDFQATADKSGVLLTWETPPEERYSYIEIWESIDDQLINATLLATVRASSYFRTSDTEITRYYWIRSALSGPGGATARSTFVPDGLGLGATFGGGQTGPAGEDAVSFSVTADGALQFVQAPNGGSWSHAQVDVTYTFEKGGTQIATHVVRFTRSGSTISAATFSTTGEATTATILGNGTETVTAVVVHDDSAVGVGQTVSAVSGGAKGDPGEDGLLQQYVFQRSATQPATPTGDGVPTGWSDVPPAPDGNPLWTSVATQESDGTTQGTWSTPTHLDGARWLSGAGAPAGSLGVLGDRYLDENNGDTYEKTGTTTWTLRNSITTVTGFVEPSGPASWVRDTDQTTWTPTATTVDLDATFRKGGEAVARRAWRITRDSNGFLTGASTAHKDGDLNTGRVTVTEIDEGTRAMSVRFDYAHNNDVSSLEQTVTATLSGAEGADGSDGIDAGNWVFTGSFSASDVNTVAWTSGSLIDTQGNTQSINAGNTGNMTAVTYIYWDPASPTAFQTTTDPSTAVGSGRILIAVAQNAADGDEAFFKAFSATPNPILLTADHIAAKTVTAQKLAAQLAFVSDLVINTGGKIRMDAAAGYDDDGIFIGEDGGEAAFSIRNGSAFLRFKPSVGHPEASGDLKWFDGAVQTFTPTWEGFSTAPSGNDLSYLNLGTHAMIWNGTGNNMTGVSNSSLFRITNVPAAIRPTVSVTPGGVIRVIDNSTANYVAHGTVDSAGEIQFFRFRDVSGNTKSDDGWTASGSKGIQVGGVLLYPII